MGKSKFQTEIDIPEFKWQTGYDKKNLFLGSCFTENVGNKMQTLKYDVNINPFGILYNPASITKGLRILIQNKIFKKEELIKHNGLWHSFNHHGKFSRTVAFDALKTINDRIHSSSIYLRNADFLFITFGTAWVYRYKETREIVSNCHKIPATRFERSRLSVDDIVKDYLKLLTEIRKVNPDCKIIFTVSPIRHWKDGAVENQRSKATLILAIDNIIKEASNQKYGYFPAYEIVMDELRDYRFYSDDMIHISEVAVNHIWNKFEHCLIEENNRKIANGIENINKAFQHKPFNRFSDEYLNFLNATLNQVKELESKFPNLNFELEKVQFMTEIDEIRKNLEQF